MKKSLLLLAALSLVACKDKEDEAVAPRVKRVVRVGAMENRFIELDDGARYGMGENLHNRLVTRLEQSGKFLVVVEGAQVRNANLLRAAQEPAITEPDPSDRLRFDFAPVPAADYSAVVSSLSFTHGNRGVKRFAGYSPEFETPFNNGALENKNEYPPRSVDFVSSWFGTNFDPVGDAATGSIAGVDAGMEGEFNLLVASVNYRRDSYRAAARLEGTLRILADNQEKKKILDVNGDGFLFALGVGYKELNVEFGLARRTALKETFDRAVEKMAAEIENELFASPFRTRVEKVGGEGIILNAGRREGIRIGDTFLHNANGRVTKLKVVESFRIGSRVEAEAGADLLAGDVAVLEENTASPAPAFAGVGAKNAPGALSPEIPDNREAKVPVPAGPATLSKITLDPPQLHDADGVKKGLKAKNKILPYLLLRYVQYDQDRDQKTFAPRGDLQAAAKAKWNLAAVHAAEAWARGLTGQGVKVAVIDSGVDYNHKNLGAAFGPNPGFDFVSHDARPFDDNSHGTAVAGLIAAQGSERNQAGLAPGSTVLSYKVFDPYGLTTSAALYGAFDRAIRDGAKVIVCAWATKRYSEALARATQLAEEKGVLVVTSAGDQGEDLRVTAQYPAAYNRAPHVLTVTALDKNNALSTVSGRHANYGAGIVDLAAPGVELEVLGPRSDYLTRTGTDLAAAHVAGVAALVWEKYPAATAAEVKDRILRGARREVKLQNQVTEGRVLDAAGATE